MAVGRDAPDAVGGGPYHSSIRAVLDEATRAVVSRAVVSPRWGVVLGSGLGGFAERLDGLVRVPFGDVPHMPRTNVSGHAGELCFGRSAGVPVACLRGRVHLYEGHAVDRVVLGVRLLVELGCRFVLLTNAAGGIRRDLSPGTFMLITDHMNLSGENPLKGLPDPFVDMSRAYDPEIADAARRAARDADIGLAEGVYAGVLGPSYETPAEVRMLARLGADAVGMSTVVEAIALRHAGARVGGLSCITNSAAGVTEAPLRHSEVQDVGSRVAEPMIELLRRWIEVGDSHQQGAAT
jgi:purine-nucleoside phosphorylase